MGGFPRHGLAMLGAVALTLSGCASIDRFSGQMATYNTEVERAQDQAIMLNVLRAADYRPLSFTDLQNISDTVTPSAAISLAAPLGQNGSMTPSMINPSIGFTGGPTISASYIGTQDFYRGVLTPLPTSTIDLLVQRRIPSTVLFNLLISRIIVSQAPNSQVDDGKLPTAEVFVAVNEPVGDDRKLAAFQDLAEALLNEGLTTGPADTDPTTVGPLLIDRDLTADDFMAKVATAGLTVKDVDLCGLGRLDAMSLMRRSDFDFPRLESTIKPACDALDALKKDPNTPKSQIDAATKVVEGLEADAKAPLVYRLVKAAPPAGAKFCMAKPRSSDGHTAVASGLCAVDAIESGPAPKSGAFSVRISLRKATPTDKTPTYTDNERRLCNALNETAMSGSPLDCGHTEWLANGLDVALEPRSTYSIIYYLGELERRERRGDTPVFIKVGDAMTAIPEGRCASPNASMASGYHCDVLFYMAPTQARTGDYLAVSYAGRRYVVADQGVEVGKTNEVLDILNELIALDRSAKDAPASSLLTVVGVH